MGFKRSFIHPFEKEQWYQFQPKQDITAHELANIMKKIPGCPSMSGSYHSSIVNPLPPHLQRHFK